MTNNNHANQDVLNVLMDDMQDIYEAMERLHQILKKDNPGTSILLGGIMERFTQVEGDIKDQFKTLEVH